MPQTPCQLITPASREWRRYFLHTEPDCGAPHGWRSVTEADAHRPSYTAPCPACGGTIEAGARMRATVWDTPDGTNQHPGDMFWLPCLTCPWDNCPGEHLHVILPNRRSWDIDGRASNCTMRDERTHRCWIRHGTPPHVTVDKAGFTCQAGAGSILLGDYHGFLREGALT